VGKPGERDALLDVAANKLHRSAIRRTDRGHPSTVMSWPGPPPDGPAYRCGRCRPERPAAPRPVNRGTADPEDVADLIDGELLLVIQPAGSPDLVRRQPGVGGRHAGPGLERRPSLRWCARGLSLATVKGPPVCPRAQVVPSRWQMTRISSRSNSAKRREHMEDQPAAG
jgi:hypothetical protein